MAEQQKSFEETIRATIERIGPGASELLAGLKTQGAKVREQFKSGCGHSLEAHMMVTGAIRSAMLRHNGKPARLLRHCRSGYC